MNNTRAIWQPAPPMQTLPLLLVDARTGIKRQTRRHLAILDLAGVRRVVLAVNKMGPHRLERGRLQGDFGRIRSFGGKVPVPILDG